MNKSKSLQLTIAVIACVGCCSVPLCTLFVDLPDSPFF